MQDRANEYQEGESFVSANDDVFEVAESEQEAESTVQTYNADLRDQLNDRLESHNTVKHSVLLRAKVQMVNFPENEKQMKKAYEQVVKSFSLDKEEYSFEKFQSLAVDADERQFRAAMIESIPAERLKEVSEQEPNRGENKIIDNLPLEYEFQEEQNTLGEELREIDELEGQRHRDELAQELEDPLDLYMSMQKELDEIMEMEAEHERAMQEASKTVSLNTFEDKVEFLYGEKSEAKLNTADKMMNADSLSEAAQLADNKATTFMKSVDGHGGKENEMFSASQMQSFIENDFDALGEADKIGGRDALGGDNDLRKAANRAVQSGKVNDEFYDLQAQEVSGLDENVLSRKAELEDGIYGLLEERGGEIMESLNSQRAEMSMDIPEMETVEDLRTSAYEMQMERERVRQMEVQLEQDDSLALNR